MLDDDARSMNHFEIPPTKNQRRGYTKVPWVTAPKNGKAASHRWRVAEWVHQRVYELRVEWPLGSRGLMYELTRDPRIINPATGKRYTKSELNDSDGNVNWNRLTGDLRRLYHQDHPLGIPFKSLIDDRTASTTVGLGNTDPDAVAASAIDWILSAEWDRHDGQPRSVVVMVEAAGEVAALRRAAGPLPVQWMSGQGFVPVLAKRDLALEARTRFEAEDKPTLIGHVGDFDPAGVQQFINLRDDVRQFIIDDGGDPECVAFERITLTSEQVEEHIDSEARNPVKREGKFSCPWWPTQWGGSAEFEDLDRSVRNGFVVDWIHGVMNMNLVEAARDRDGQLRTDAARIVSEFDFGVTP